MLSHVSLTHVPKCRKCKQILHVQVYITLAMSFTFRVFGNTPKEKVTTLLIKQKKSQKINLPKLLQFILGEHTCLNKD